MSEFVEKQEHLLTLIAEKNLDALLLTRVSSFAWATCGRSSYVALTSGDGIASLLITPNQRYVITNNIEAPRLRAEEGLAEQGWQFEIEAWYAAGKALPRLVQGLQVGSDSTVPGTQDLSLEISRLRNRLTAAEGDRFRRLGQLCAQAFDPVMYSILPGQTERQIAARLAFETEVRGVQPVAIMVATDERIFQYRHPLPTDRPLQKYAMVILCGRKYGLVCSLTRLVHFGKPPSELSAKLHAVAQVDATIIAHTRPGRTIGELFSIAQQAYAQTGWPDEWQNHHQGGSAGYEPREMVAIPGMTEIIHAGQAFAWNPSIRGAKSEDTILIGNQAYEILTAMPGWPTINIEISGQTVPRPGILEL